MFYRSAAASRIWSVYMYMDVCGHRAHAACMAAVSPPPPVRTPWMALHENANRDFTSFFRGGGGVLCL
jgi:hypothetical protein